MNSLRARWLLVGLFILWTFFVLGTFYAVQKPFAAINAQAVGEVLLNLLTAAWLALIGLGAGVWVLSRLRLDLSLGEVVVLGAGLGLGVLGLLSLSFGWLGLFRPVVAYLVTLVLTGLAAPQLWRLWQAYRRHRLVRSTFPPTPSTLPSPFSPLPTPVYRLPSTVYCLLIALFTLLVALLPPTDWDGLFYHLTGPSLYLQAGRIIGGFDLPHLNFPSLMEMLFAWAMLLRGDIAAKLIHTVYGFLLAGLVYLTTARFLSWRAAWLAVVVFASMPMISTLAGWAYNDLALVFYQLAALYAVLRWQGTNCQSQPTNLWPPPTPKRQGQSTNYKSQTANRQSNTPGIHNSQFSWLVLSGLLVGLAMGLKYTSFVTPLVLSGLVIWYSYRRAGGRGQRTEDREHRTGSSGRPSRFLNYVLRFAVKNLVAFALPALLVALPWYTKNWAFTGNPVYPFLSGLFGGQYWNEFRADWYAAAGTGIGWRPGTLLVLPWLLTLGVRDVNYWDGRTGPLLLLFLPLIIWAGFSRRFVERRAVLGGLLFYALAHYIFWMVGVMWSRSLWQSRLLLPGLVALTPIAGWLWAYLPNFDLSRFSVSRFVNITLGLILALTVVDGGLLTLDINPWPYLAGLETRDAYLTRRLGAYYETMQQIDEVLPPEATVVFLWEPRTYYCQRDCRPDSILDTFPHLVNQYGSAEAIIRAWQQAGVSHVLIHRSGLEFVLNESPEAVDKAILAELEAGFLQPVFDVMRAYQVYILPKQ
ncbi:MAG: hypothetical protein JXM69_21170 [Anaerolineae bacterium]|nr:hypothetical protein [Anaerolineae bacterium]